MKNKLRFLIILIILYFCSYIFYGKNSLGLQIIENTTFSKAQDSIQIQIFDLEDYNRNQLEITKIIKEKGLKNVHVNYAENFLNDDKFSYWLDVEPLTPFITFSYDGFFKKNEISEEYESLYIWCFFKWIRVYKSDNRAMY